MPSQTTVIFTGRDPAGASSLRERVRRRRHRLLPLLAAFAAVLIATPAAAGRASTLGAIDVETGQVAVEYIAHACFRLHADDGSVVMIDPWADREWIGYDFPRGLEADVILVTHPHFDHDGGVFMGKQPPWPESARVVTRPARYSVGPFTVTGLVGRHAEPYGEEFDHANTIWLIEVAGLRIAHLGDNRPVEEKNRKVLEGIDVLMVPVDDQEHIIDHDVITWMLRVIEPQILIPMHYRHDDLEPEAGEPDDLGGIKNWLKTQQKNAAVDVRRVNNHVVTLSADSLPDTPTILVPRHSPAVVRPAAERPAR